MSVIRSGMSALFTTLVQCVSTLTLANDQSTQLRLMMSSVLQVCGHTDMFTW